MEKNKCGIYCFTNVINNKKYIGQSINIEDRYNQHKYRYKNNNDNGYGCAFHSALRKYGWNSFSFEIIEECSSEKLDEKEQYWINKNSSIVPNGYNIEPGGRRNKNKRKYNEEDYICPDCGNKKDPRSGRCKKCSNINNQKKNIGCIKSPLLSDDMVDISLIDEILSSSFESVAKKYGYKSGNAIKKRLIANGFPGKKDALFKYYKQQTGKEHPSFLKKQEEEKKKKEQREKCKPKKVGKFNDNGELLEIFDSTRDAHRAGYSSGPISDCCNGKRKHHKGYVWKYI